MVSRTAPTAPAVAFCCRLTLRASVEHGGRDAETVDETVVPGGHMQPSQCAYRDQAELRTVHAPNPYGIVRMSST